MDTTLTGLPPIRQVTTIIEPARFYETVDGAIVLACGFAPGYTVICIGAMDGSQRQRLRVAAQQEWSSWRLRDDLTEFPQGEGPGTPDEEPPGLVTHLTVFVAMSALLGVVGLLHPTATVSSWYGLCAVAGVPLLLHWLLSRGGPK